MQDKINTDLVVAMKAGEKTKVGTLKMLKSALQMAAIENKGDLSEAQVIAVIKKESKKRSEAAEMFARGGNEEKASAEKAEKVIIDTYLPEQMSEDQITEIVDRIIATSDNPNMGQVMGQVMPKVGGQADGGTVSRIVREKLQ